MTFSLKKAFIFTGLITIGIGAVPGLSQSGRHKPIAATVGEINLYWQKNRGESFPLDTIGLDNVEKKLCDTAEAGSTTVSSAAAFLTHAGKVLYRLENPSAIALALFTRCGYPVILSSQLAADIAIASAVTGPGAYPAQTQGNDNQATPADVFGLESGDLSDTSGQLRYQKMRICSDFLWQMIDTCAIYRPEGTFNDFRVQIYCAGLGYCEFMGQENVMLNSKSVRGIQGFAVQNHWLGYQADGQVSRLFLNIYICADRRQPPAAIRKQVEAKMDAFKLDLTYKFPRLAPVPVP